VVLTHWGSLEQKKPGKGMAAPRLFWVFTHYKGIKEMWRLPPMKGDLV